MSSRLFAASSAILAFVALGACDRKELESSAQAKAAGDDAAKKVAAAPAQPAAAPARRTRRRGQPNPDRNAYFGEAHIHTSWSVDAWVMGNRITGPGDAYKYAQGETIKHPMGFDIKIDTPIDFMGVTDHSEYVGVTKEANTPGSYVSKLPEAQPMIMKDPNSTEEQNRVFSYLLKLARRRAGEGVHEPEDHFHRVEGKRQARRREQSSRQVHRVLLVRVDVDAGQPQPAPQRLLPGLRQGTGLPIQRARLHSPHGALELDGRAAQEPATSCSRSRTTPTSATAGCIRSTSTTPPGGRSTPPGRPRATATSAWLRSSRARGNRRRIPCCRPMTSLQAMRCMRPSSAFRPTSAASITSRAATRARRTRTASRCRTRAATTPTSSGWPAAPTRTTPAARTARTTSTACTPMRTGRSSGALPAY